MKYRIEVIRYDNEENEEVVKSYEASSQIQANLIEVGIKTELSSEHFTRITEIEDDEKTMQKQKLELAESFIHELIQD